ncbi:hypothetical protein [Nocardia sp. NPDC050710]|uniref:hypothetical protein n=1 Tax=Nocardia sp. NPDC050710 TaxID=3157220 RepID=UPI0033F54FB6
MNSSVSTGQADIVSAPAILGRPHVTPQDPLADGPSRTPRPVPTFSERILKHVRLDAAIANTWQLPVRMEQDHRKWPERTIDEPTATEPHQVVETFTRNGKSAAATGRPG